MVPEPGLNPQGPPYFSGGQQPPVYPGGFQPGPNQVFWPAVPAKPSALPVVPREYHEFFRAPRFRWWKPLVAIAMFVGAWFIGSLVMTIGAMAYDVLTGRIAPDDLAAYETTVTPMLFTANNLALALAIPFAGLTAWAVFGQRPKWMSSIFGGFRWRLFWRFAAVAAVVDLVYLGISLLTDDLSELRWNSDSAFLIVAILLTTPFQAAGEEYGVRGFLARSIGSWFGSRRVGLVVATAITSLVFMVLHGADNFWLNLFYIGVGVACSILVWRTGGLEAAVALHVFNNLFSEVTLPFMPLDDLFNRGPEAAGVEALLPLTFTFLVMAGMLWVARRQRVASISAPGAQPLPVL
ncbi:MAG TPA: CPBP family intramembrane metalloprotease [Propionicimonas sp.]|nr:CPBP family intramembrane metalloprotease [Propionicimonas sp.]HRA05557.1 CPBP family intramembrane metalloprotease [Propionicimonas sp.]